MWANRARAHAGYVLSLAADRLVTVLILVALAVFAVCMVGWTLLILRGDPG